MEKPSIPEKARVLKKLKEAHFNVPDFIYVPASDFDDKNYELLNSFLEKHRENFKIIARSAHPHEEFFRGGTFESLETYADIGGVEYARKRMIKFPSTVKRLSILRQQRFNNAPEIDPEEMGVIVMPFIEGASAMAKMIDNQWEFGYSPGNQKVQKAPYVTRTPHDRKLIQLSEDIQKHLGFRCEIEYIIADDNAIFVVQAKDISKIDIPELTESKNAIYLDGIRRIRKRHNYRERSVFLMDKKQLYLDVINKCEEMIFGCEGKAPDIKDILEIFTEYEAGLEDFALKHQRFAVIEITVRDPHELYQIANHYLDEIPDLQQQLSRALNENLYKIDYFLAEADTFLAKDKLTINMCTHDAYGIDTVRNPLWSVYWYMERHEKILKEFKGLGFKTDDTAGIEIVAEEKPIVYRL
ncbi:MAG: hypothetical protein R6U27_13715 [Desulfobacterales bacterium]